MTYYVRLSVPTSLQEIVGKREFVRSLRTNVLNEAIRKARLVSADFERWLADGAPPAVQPPAPAQVPAIAAAAPVPPTVAPAAFAKAPVPPAKSKSLRQVMEIFLSDPTKNRSLKATSYYLNAVEVAEAVIGPDTPIAEISRQSGRDVVEMLKSMPSNAKKLFPALDYKEIAAKGKTGRYRLLGPKTLNDYLTKLSTLMNFAIDEGVVDRNPFKGLKVEDEVHPRDKRHPFDDKQLRQIFDAPLYRGCLNDEDGYDQPGHERPRRGRFWVPLIALFSGMRLNEICQLDIGDVKTIGGVECFVITTDSVRGRKDKKVKTRSSRRIIPVHRSLIELGFLEYVAAQRRAGKVKLFSELPISTTGYYSDPFSKWFARFLDKCGASRDKTSFHSFRHNFRDAIREAKLDHEIGLLLGGWTSSSGRDAEVASNYGRGHSPAALKEAIDKICYPTLTLDHLRPDTPPAQSS